MEKFSEPEILKAPLEQTLLQLKSIGAKDLFKFPFVTRPPLPAIKAALRHLTILGALEVNSRATLNMILESSEEMTSDPTKINQLGMLLAKVPLSPKFAKMLVVAAKYDVLDYSIMMVACMSVNEVFKDLPPTQSAAAQQSNRREEEEQAAELVTTLDLERQEKEERKRRRMEQEEAHERVRETRQSREKWTSEKSDCITYVKLMVDYFSWVNSNRPTLSTN